VVWTLWTGSVKGRFGVPERRLRDADGGGISAGFPWLVHTVDSRRLSYPPLSTGYPPLIPSGAWI